MNVRSVSTMGMGLLSRQSISDTQKQLLVLQQEQATGKHFDVAGKLGAQTSRDILLRESYNEAQSYLLNNRTLSSRIEVTQHAFSNMTSNGNDFVTKIVAALSGETAAGFMPSAAADLIENIESALNASFGGRSLFSGTVIDAQPLQLSRLVHPTTGYSPMEVIQNVIAAKPPVTDAASLADLLSGPDGIASVFDSTHTDADYHFGSTFYNGNDQDVAAKIDTSTSVPGGARANDEGVRLMLRAAYTLAAIDPDSMPAGQYRQVLDAAMADIQAGMFKIQQRQAVLGLSEQSIERSNERHSLMSDLMAKQITALEEVDPYETAVRLSHVMTQIESTFSVTARINRLSLINFL
jgi:flagellar hook-associated protein 3 FlgL